MTPGTVDFVAEFGIAIIRGDFDDAIVIKAVGVDFFGVELVPVGQGRRFVRKMVFLADINPFVVEVVVKLDPVGL